MVAENELFPEITEHFDKRGEEIMRNAKPTSSFVMHPAMGHGRFDALGIGEAADRQSRRGQPEQLQQGAHG